MLDFFFNPDALRAEFLRRVERTRRDPLFGLPEWIRTGGPDALRGCPVFVCGSSQIGCVRAAIRNYDVVGIVDDFRTGELYGVPYVSTQAWIDAARRDPRVRSIVAVESAPAYNHFTRIATQFGFPYVDLLGYARVADLDTHPGAWKPVLLYGTQLYKHALANAEALADLGRVFADEYSRITLFSILLYRLTFDTNLLDRSSIGYVQAYRYNAYMLNRPLIELGDDEVFVDGGAFGGETLEQFVRACRGKFRRIYSFEPAADGFASTERTIARIAPEFLEDIRPRIELFKKGLWSHATRLRFDASILPASHARSEHEGDRLAAHIVESGFTSHLPVERVAEDDFAIDTVAIDDVCTDPVTFLKLEIEGSELAALEGARKTLARHRPKLSISIYHKPEDLLTLTALLKETVPAYELVLRHHGRNPNATVCYAAAVR